MDTYRGRQNCEAGSVNALFRRLGALVRALPAERQQALIEHIEHDMTLSEDLREAIVASGKSHYRLAQEAGITPGVISRFVSGERDLRLETASKLAELLGIRLTKPRAPKT